MKNGKWESSEKEEEAKSRERGRMVRETLKEGGKRGGGKRRRRKRKGGSEVWVAGGPGVEGLGAESGA